MGGTRKQENSQENTKLKGGINYTPNYTPIQVNEDLTISEGQLRENIYSNYKTLGYRPGPGIESVSIESKNTYGTLREAKIKIVAWTLEDLEVIQALYMRPGYSMLLEWGHSLYIDNTGEISRENIPLYNGFLNNSNQTSIRIEKDLADKRAESQGNYDAMYGIVKNFNWSFRQDGGYDCEVTLISKGSVLESISIMFDPAETMDPDGDGEKNTEGRKSPFHRFLQDLAKSDVSSFGKSFFIANAEEGTYSKLQDFYAIRIDLDTSRDLGDLEDRGQFITLRTLLDFYNKYVAYNASNVEDVLDKGRKTSLTKYYTGQGEEETGKYLKESKYVTTKHHFSIDPMKCLFPKEFKAPQAFDGPEYSTLRLYKIEGIKQLLEKNIKKGEPDDILNIYVSNHQLSVLIEDLSNQKDVSQHNMFTYVKNILDDMSSVAGGVNDFDQLYDESEDMWFIVDRKKTPTQEAIKDHAKLNLTGLSSTVTDLSISSKISNEISAQVSIAAQGTGNNYKENVSTLLKWNSGLIDRTLPIKSLTEEDYNKTIEDEEKRQKAANDKMIEWAKEVRLVYQQYSTTGDGNLFNWDIEYDEAGHTALKAGHAKYCSRFVIDKYCKDKNDPKPPPGVIPVEFSFTTIGIGGLKIGQAFTIADGILPKSYKDFGHIITGLSHSLENSKWKTSVKTQLYSIKAPAANEIPEGITTVDPLTGVTATPEQLNELDPAPKINTGRIGGISYSASPLAKKLQSELNFNGLLPLSSLEPIGETQGAAKYYINPKTGRPEYMLHPAAAKAWYEWRDEMKTQGVNYSISSGYRNSQQQGGLDTGRAASPGRSPHGWGGALDFRNLYREVGGSTNLTTNVNGRIQSPDYTKMAEIGKKYGWYNPWRLSNNGGTMDELWHWEYWGNV